MKKVTLSLLMLVMAGFSQIAYSQIGGIRAGYQAANIYENGNSIDGAEALPSFYIGFSKYKDLVPMLDLGSGLEYFQNGTKYNDDTKVVLHYLSLPISLRVKLGPVFALGGIAPSIKISETRYIAGEKFTPGNDDKLNWFDAPVFIGAGVKVLVFSLEARYHWGTMELSDGDGTKNQYFQIGAGVSF